MTTGLRVTNRWSGTGFGRRTIGTAAALAPTLIVLVLAGVLAVKSWSAWGAMRWGGDWGPGGPYGLGKPLFGTVVVGAYATLGALVLGTPIALYLNWYAGPGVRAVGREAVRLLTAAPTAVLGLLGMTLVVPLIGLSGFSAALVLLMITLPTYISISSGWIDALPGGFRLTCRSLGLGEGWPTVRILLRELWRPLLAAASAASARAMGEAVAVRFVCGNHESLSFGPGPVLTLGSKIANSFGDAPLAEEAALCAAGVVLAAVVGFVSLIGLYAARRSRR